MRPLCLSLVALLVVAVPPANAGPAVRGPVFNGEFELAADAARPAVCLAFGPGYINLFEPGNPFGLPWLASVNPCESGAVKALQWSSGQVTQFGDFDADGDREARVTPGVVDPVVGAAHNFWQAYSNSQQAWVADFDALTFRVEAGEVPPSALVQLSLSSSPLSDASPFVGVFIDCFLTFTDLEPAADGTVTLSPLDGEFAAAWGGCDDEAAAYNDPAATADERRAVLANMRLVQHSYWNFQAGAGPVVLDGVDILGARNVAESAAGL